MKGLRPGLSQQPEEAEGSLTPGGAGEGGSSPDNDGTGRHCQAVRVRQARREGVRKNPASKPLKCRPPAPTWRIWAGPQRTLDYLGDSDAGL
jgi:hypothetical protein